MYYNGYKYILKSLLNTFLIHTIHIITFVSHHCYETPSRELHDWLILVGHNDYTLL